MEINQNKYIIIGAGISGVGAANLLAKYKADLVLFDANKELDIEKLKGRLTTNERLRIVIGELEDSVIEDREIAVLSPGGPVDSELVKRLKSKNIKIWGELELSYQIEKGRVFAITGTNGKTTTTSLLGEIMKNYKEKVFVAGNIGVAYTDCAYDTDKDSVTVLEVSSFQLETIESFRPKISCILNITPDHLDRHHTLENYIQTKESITKNQSPDDICVLNYEDENLKKFGDSANVNVLYFSSARRLDKGLYLEGDSIIYNDGTKATEICKVFELNLLGLHNYENVMAACAMAISADVPMDIIKTTIKNFKAVEHRIEFVAVKRGVYYYNDSKGTNPDAAIKGIQAMTRPTYLIGGGYDKNAEFDEWINSFDGKVKKLVLIGQTREKIAETAKRNGFNDVVLADTFEEAVKICEESACKDEAVLLSPACASWGMFKNYEERGRIFKQLVNDIKE